MGGDLELGNDPRYSYVENESEEGDMHVDGQGETSESGGYMEGSYAAEVEQEDYE
jgi:hypothetical protein